MWRRAGALAGAHRRQMADCGAGLGCIGQREMGRVRIALIAGSDKKRAAEHFFRSPF
ncbi:MAG: hypothetical protein ACOYI4_02290 [Christensenellales bacterium]